MENDENVETIVYNYFHKQLESNPISLEIIYPTQQSIADAIKESTGGEIQISQSAISKALKKIMKKLFEVGNRSYRLIKEKGGYQLQSVDGILGKNRKVLEDSNEIDPASFYRNSFHGMSTCFGFKVIKERNTENIEKKISHVKQMFQDALGNVLFDSWVHGESLFLFLDATKSDFKKAHEWLVSLPEKLR